MFNFYPDTVVDDIRYNVHSRKQAVKLDVPHLGERLVQTARLYHKGKKGSRENIAMLDAATWGDYQEALRLSLITHWLEYDCFALTGEVKTVRIAHSCEIDALNEFRRYRKRLNGDSPDPEQDMYGWNLRIKGVKQGAVLVQLTVEENKAQKARAVEHEYHALRQYENIPYLINFALLHKGLNQPISASLASTKAASRFSVVLANNTSLILLSAQSRSLATARRASITGCTGTTKARIVINGLPLISIPMASSTRKQ